MTGGTVAKVNLCRRLSALLLPGLLFLSTACGGGGGGGGGGGDGGDALAAAPAEEAPLAVAPAPAPAAPELVPETKMTNVVTGAVSSPRAYIGQDKPVLYWFWAPH